MADPNPAPDYRMPPPAAAVPSHSPAAMAPRTTSALGPLHASLKSSATFTPAELAAAWTDFIVPATDTKGHSNYERVAMSPMMGAEIENIVASRLFPYRRNGEFWRHAGMRLLAWLRALEPTMKSTYYGALLAEQDLLKEEQVKQDTETTFKKMEERLGALMDADAMDEAAVFAYRLWEKVQYLPETTWKKKFVRRFERMYGTLAEDGRVLSEMAQAEATGHLQLPPPAPGAGLFIVPEPEPRPTATVLQMPLPLVSGITLANDGYPLVEAAPYQWPDTVPEDYTGPSPEDIVTSVLFGSPFPVIESVPVNYHSDELVDAAGEDSDADDDGYIGEYGG